MKKLASARNSYKITAAGEPMKVNAPKKLHDNENHGETRAEGRKRLVGNVGRFEAQNERGYDYGRISKKVIIKEEIK